VTSLLPIASDSGLKDIVENAVIMENISAPINEGDVLGYVEFTWNGKSLGKVNLLAERPIELKTRAVIKSRIIDFLNTPIIKKIVIPAFIVVVAFLALRIVLRTISRRLRSRRF